MSAEVCRTGEACTASAPQGQEVAPSWLTMPSLSSLLPELPSLLPLGRVISTDPGASEPSSAPDSTTLSTDNDDARRPSPIRDESQATLRARPEREAEAVLSSPEPAITTPAAAMHDDLADTSRRSVFRAFRPRSRSSVASLAESALTRVSTRAGELGRKHKGTKVSCKGLKFQDRLLPSEMVCLHQLIPPDFAVSPLRKLSCGSLDSRAVLAMALSPCGRWLASAGRCQIVYIWERIQGIYMELPARAFIGHEGEILNLAWSKGGFLLSSGMDKHARLWHPDRDECLGVFEHDDFVTSVAFNPLDDRLFATTAMDRKLRIWSAPDNKVLKTATTPSIPTAVTYSPDGSEIVTGGLKGDMVVWTEELHTKASVKVRSSRGKNKKPSKITGITYEDDILVSSNDSRVRLYSPELKVKLKFKGHENQTSHIQASSRHGRVASGSEDGFIYIWNAQLPSSTEAGTFCEFFDAESPCSSVLFSERDVVCASQAGVILVFGVIKPEAK